MMMIQRGMNSKYPEKINTWRLGENIPEWLSDRAKVLFIDGDGNITLDLLKLDTGGVEIKNSDGKGILVKMETGDSVLCYSNGKNIFSLKPKQLELLYQEEEKK